MTRIAIFGSTILFGVLLFGVPMSETEAIVTEKVLTADVSRFGLNLGGWSFWGPDQFQANILKNPGFEGLIDGAIAMPAHSTANTFDDSPAWLARPSGFWNGAAYSIRSGPRAGSGGVVSESRHSGPDGLPVFVARSGDPIPDSGNAVAIVKDTESDLPTRWWYSNDLAAFSPELTQRRPGSPGSRSLRIVGSGIKPATLSSYFDSIGGHAGKFLPLDGEWHLSFWARVDKGGANLHVSFGRDGAPAALSRDVPLTGSWNNVSLTFHASDAGPAGTVALRFDVSGAPLGEVLLDDVDLRRTDDEGQSFRHEVLEMVDRFHPAYLREWQGQLADTASNRIAPAFARKSYRCRPGDSSQIDFGYGLPDFLDLCVRVKSTPWLIIPPVFNDDDCRAMGDYLASRTDLNIFPEVLVEFGNENWNSIFRPAAVPDPVAHGEASGRCFAALRSRAPRVRLKTIVNAQADYPDSALQFARASKVSDIVGIAPYFLYSLPKSVSLRDRIAMLFARDANTQTIVSAMPGLNKELAVYEMNLHTVNGDASEAERKPVVAGMAAGSALARNMLDTLALGVRRQCVYTLTGFEAKLTSQQGTVPLWGIVRDLGATKRLRPTGLALQLLNEVLAGDMRQVRVRGADDVFVYAFRTRSGWTAVAVSASATQRQLTIRFPQESGRRAKDSVVKLRSLFAQSEMATNEETEGVTIIEEQAPVLDSAVSLTLAPWQMTVLSRSGDN